MKNPMQYLTQCWVNVTVFLSSSKDLSCCVFHTIQGCRVSLTHNMFGFLVTQCWLMEMTLCKQQREFTAHSFGHGKNYSCRSLSQSLCRNFPCL